MDSTTGEYDAQPVESSEPVVTGWERSPPERQERPVGTWDVTPNADGVEVESAGGRLEIPERIKASLRAEADETGAAVSKTTTLRYSHDRDSRETEARPQRASAAEMARASTESNKQSQLNPHYERLARLLRAQQEQRPKANKNRRRASRSGDKQKGYKLSQIVVVQEPTHGRRVGGL